MSAKRHFQITCMATSQEFIATRLRASFTPPITLDYRSATPIWRQISVWFQRAIVAGQLQTGQRVPSSRTLARELGISRIPVVSAYELLIAEGYFRTFVGDGTYVSESIPDAHRPDRDGLVKETALDPGFEARRPVSRRAAHLGGPAQAWVERSRGCTDLEHFPVGIWSKLIKRHARNMSRDVMGYGDPMGYGPFREAVAHYLGAYRAVNCDPSQIMVTTGAQQGLLFSALALLDPGDTAWVEEPGYPATHQALRVAGARLAPVPVDAQGLNVECAIRTEPGARAAFVTPSHQFPLGVTMSATRRIELLTWAAVHGAWVIEDDYDSEYRFSENPIASLQGLDVEGRVIYVGTLTKMMFPALRLGYIIIPKDLVSGFLRIRSAIDTFSTSVHHQMAMTDFIREGHFSRHLNRMRSVYMKRRALLTAAIRARTDGALSVIGEEAGMLLVALLRHGMDDVEIAAKAQRMGVRVKALSQCYVDPPQRGGLMLDYANSSPEAIQATIDALMTIICAGRH